MPGEATLKLPGWTRRPAELTPPLNLWASTSPADRLNLEVFLDPANDVAYKMIGGAYGVLGAEVLGYYVPRALDTERWGVYVREAGVAWLCSRLTSRVGEGDQQEIGLLMRLARAIAVHHLVHFAVERAFIATRGIEAYLASLRDNAPRHPPSEEALADALSRAEAVTDLSGESRSMVLDALNNAINGPSVDGVRPAHRELLELLAEANKDLELALDEAGISPSVSGRTVPQYLVLEPHLPESTATEVRRAVLIR